jgi:hypothetical protein
VCVRLEDEAQTGLSLGDVVVGKKSVQLSRHCAEYGTEEE